MSKETKIVFMGTAGFAVPSLKAILDAGYHVEGVVTAPDKPAGRGRKLSTSPVKDFALANHLNVLQPANLKDTGFIQQLLDLKPDLQVVVAFRMLPEVVWSLPPMGTFNLHASLLPQYRGAAPINHAIINGETTTGVTTFLINEKIDTGRIIGQSKTTINPDETAGELHDRLQDIGSSLVVSTIKELENYNYEAIVQEEQDDLKPAPKIFREDCKINWNKPATEVHNFIRGLSPYPAAHTFIASNEQGKISQLKLLLSRKSLNDSGDLVPGEIFVSSNGEIFIGCKSGKIEVLQIQPEGKKRMSADAYLRGNKLPKFISKV